MSDKHPVIDFPESEMPLSDEAASGIYANSIQHVLTDKEVIIDFSFILPGFHRLTQRRTLGENRPVQNVVARIVVTPQIFADFIKSAIHTNPELFFDEIHERANTTEQVATRGPSISKNDNALAIVRSFRSGDVEEQRETLHQLMQGLDRERPDGQKLFSEQ